MEMVKEAGKMIAEGAGGAVLAWACESFLKSIGKCCLIDDSVLVSVKSTVEHLKEMTKMEDHNMKLGDRQDEVKELKEEMERGTRLLDELPGFNKLSYNEQLADLDASLKSLVEKLRLQLACDVKEVLVSTKEYSEVVKKNTKIVLGTKRKVDGVDKNLKDIRKMQTTNCKVVKKNTEIVLCTKRKVDGVDENLKDIHKMQKEMQEEIMNMRTQNEALLGLRGEHSVEGAALLRNLRQLDDMLQDLKNPTLQCLDLCLISVKIQCNKWVLEHINHLAQLTHRIFGMVKRKTAENEEPTYIPVSELKHFRTSIENGVSLLRSCPTILEWTDKLKSEYTDKFRALENTLERLYNHLAGMRTFEWRCGNCDKSPGITSISIVDSVGFCH